LGALGFGARLADSKCETLSGGEKARLLFMLATFHKPHVLVLDEPTNHLDIDSREALVMAINDYEGAVILISHDRHIIETCADQLWLVKDGTVQPYDGDMEDYTNLVLGRAVAKPRKVEIAPAVKTNKPAKAAAPQWKASDLIARIDKHREKIEILDQALADHTIYRQDPKRAADFAKLRSKFAQELDVLETHWLELEAS